MSKIPKSFKILGNTINVKFDEFIRDRDDAHGIASYRRHEILLAPPTDSLCKGRVIENFWHEFSHWICFYTGNVINHELKTPLHTNEEFIDLMGAILKQCIESMEFEE